MVRIVGIGQLGETWRDRLSRLREPRHDRVIEETTVSRHRLNRVVIRSQIFCLCVAIVRYLIWSLLASDEEVLLWIHDIVRVDTFRILLTPRHNLEPTSMLLFLWLVSFEITVDVKVGVHWPSAPNVTNGSSFEIVAFDVGTLAEEERHYEDSEADNARHQQD